MVVLTSPVSLFTHRFAAEVAGDSADSDGANHFAANVAWLVRVGDTSRLTASQQEQQRDLLDEQVLAFTQRLRVSL